MAVTIQQLEPLVRQDYEQLCQAAGLTPVPLEIVQIVEGTEQINTHRDRLHYPHAGYDQHVIHLPFHEVELDMFPDTPAPFTPPQNHWDPLFGQTWPKWRIDLWHEAIHQYVDQALHQWTPGNRHDGPWHPATEQVAARLNVTPATLRRITEGIPVPLVGGGTVGH
jgi:hypothetical protein